MKLNDVFTRCVVHTGPDEPLAAVARKMQENNVGSVVVVDKGRPVGIITDRDLALALGTKGASPQDPVQKAMTRHVLAVPVDMGLYTATQLLRERHVRQLPVVDQEDHLVGMLTVDDLFRLLGWDLYNLAEDIEPELQAK